MFFFLFSSNNTRCVGKNVQVGKILDKPNISSTLIRQVRVIFFDLGNLQNIQKSIKNWRILKTQFF